MSRALAQPEPSLPTGTTAEATPVASLTAPAGGESWRRRAITGASWWAAMYPVQKVVQLASNVLLAALLSPAIFGLMALGKSVLQGLRMFSEMGLRPAIVSSPRGDDPDFLNTAWTLQAIRGLVLTLAMAVAAWPAAWFYGESTLLWLLPVLGLGQLIGGFRSTRFISLNRELREKPQAIVELVVGLVSRGSMIVWALIVPSVWALAGGSLIGAVLGVILSHTVVSGIRNRFRWDRAAVREIVHFGVWILIGTIIAFFAGQLDRIMLPKLDSIDLLGVYAISWTIAAMPRELASLVTSKILFPLMSKIVREDRERFAQRLRWLRGGTLPLALWGTLGMMLLAGWFFNLLYDARYADAAWMAPMLGLATWIAILNGAANRALLSMQQSRPLAFSGGLKLVILAGGALLGYHLYGVPGFILGVAAAELAQHVFDLIVLQRYGIDFMAQDIRMTGWLALLASAGLGFRHLVLPVLQPGGEYILAADLGVTLAIFGGSGAWAGIALKPLLGRGRPA